MTQGFITNHRKIAAALMYTFAKCPPSKIGAVKLHKVLYFSDMMLFAQRLVPLTGATYRKRPFGPTCDSLLGTLRELQSNGYLEIGEEDYFGFKKKTYNPLKPYVGTNELSSEEIAVLDEVIEFVCNNNSAKTISEFSHNRAWDLAELGEEIPYHSVLQMFTQEVSLEALEWAADRAQEVEAERSDTNPLGYVTLADFRGRVLSH